MWGLKTDDNMVTSSQWPLSKLASNQAITNTYKGKAAFCTQPSLFEVWMHPGGWINDWILIIIACLAMLPDFLGSDGRVVSLFPRLADVHPLEKHSWIFYT